MKDSLTLLALGCLLSADAIACSCAPMTTRDSAKAADSIYLATLQEAKIASGRSKRWPVIEGRFEIYQTLKGPTPTGVLTLNTPSDGGACGVGMLVSAKYVIFKRNGSDDIIACDGSGVLGRFGIIGQMEEHEVAAEVRAANKKQKRR